MMTSRLAYYLSQWGLSKPQLLAQTATSHVYTVKSDSETVVLKVLTPIGQADEALGAVALKYFDGRGAVQLLQADHGAHLLEYADGNDLVPLVLNGQDEQATMIIGDVLNQLHANPPPTHQTDLIPLEHWFSALFNKADDNTLFQRGAMVAERLLAQPLDQRVLHGDIHHQNIRHHQTRGWLAFDPKGLIGERTFDGANTLCNPDAEVALNETRLLRTANILAQQMQIDYQRLLAFGFAYACLSACWSLEDGDDASLALGLAHLLHPHISGD
jgi:streptomycin 6-kinase